MNRFQELPDEALSIIFGYLNSGETLSSRRVCRDWRERLVGNAYISCNCGTWFAPQTSGQPGGGNPIFDIWLKGNRVGKRLQACSSGGRAQRNREDRKRYGGVSRTKGHLPEPFVVSSTSELSIEKPFEFARISTNGVSFQMEQHENNLFWETLDLSLSSCVLHRQINDGPQGSSFTCVRPLLKRILCEVDLSGARQLQKLSVRGCSNLRTLQLPPNLVALDASSCTRLSCLSSPFGLGQKGRFEALNLKGCRSLVAQDKRYLFGAATPDAMKHLRDLDLSSTSMLEKSIVAYALNQTCCLEMLSLRYVASDDVLLALAESIAAKETLRLVDTSFSSELTDESCEVLVNAARHLERLNLRACSSVSAACYNAIPVELQQRKKPIGEDDDYHSEESFSVSKASVSQNRKGDNIFYFTRSSAAR
jgi:hypothetical protein